MNSIINSPRHLSEQQLQHAGKVGWSFYVTNSRHLLKLEKVQNYSAATVAAFFPPAQDFFS
jgi:hypothetical protein